MKDQLENSRMIAYDISDTSTVSAREIEILLDDLKSSARFAEVEASSRFKVVSGGLSRGGEGEIHGMVRRNLGLGLGKTTFRVGINLKEHNFSCTCPSYFLCAHVVAMADYLLGD